MTLNFGRRVVTLGALAGFLLGASVAEAQDLPGAQAKADQAHVVVYRVNRHRDPKMIKPSVFCDDKEVALMYSDRFLTINLPPGKHTVKSSNEKTSVTLDAQPGVTYYIEIAAVNGIFLRNTFGVKQVDANTALKDTARLKPADDKHVMDKAMVSIGAMPGK
jgi:hypothetical protein